MRFPQLGFSTTGALIATALGVSSLAATGGVEAYVSESRIARDAESFLATLKLAQSEAVKREMPVSVAADGSAWRVWQDADRNGQLADGEPLVRTEPVSKALRVKTIGGEAITFLPSGFVDLDSTASRTVVICNADPHRDGAHLGRSIRISATGTLRIAAHDCRS